MTGDSIEEAMTGASIKEAMTGASLNEVKERLDGLRERLERRHGPRGTIAIEAGIMGVFIEHIHVLCPTAEQRKDVIASCVSRFASVVMVNTVRELLKEDLLDSDDPDVQEYHDDLVSEINSLSDRLTLFAEHLFGGKRRRKR